MSECRHGNDDLAHCEECYQEAERSDRLWTAAVAALPWACAVPDTSNEESVEMAMDAALALDAAWRKEVGR